MIVLQFEFFGTEGGIKDSQQIPANDKVYIHGGCTFMLLPLYYPTIRKLTTEKCV